MQTFLPYPDYRESVLTLDKKRFFKQISETKQIICGLVGLYYPNVKSITDILPSEWKQSKSYGKKNIANHPASLMWKHNILSLMEYYNIVTSEYIVKYGDETNASYDLLFLETENNPKPWWNGVVKFHLQHQRKLIWKMPEHYSNEFPDIAKENIISEPAYIWPLPAINQYSSEFVGSFKHIINGKHSQPFKLK